jgi:signal recognition particle receptor subunit beta
MSEARETLHGILAADELRAAAVLVYANKMDSPHAADTASVAAALGLAQLRARPWHIQGCSALRGDGLYEGLDALALMNKEQRKNSRR